MRHMISRLGKVYMANSAAGVRPVCGSKYTIIYGVNGARASDAILVPAQQH